MSCFGLERAERVPDRLQEVDLVVAAETDLLVVLVARLLGPLELDLLGLAALELSELGLVLLVALAQFEVALLLDVTDLGADVAFELGEVLVPALVVDPRDRVRGEVDDLLEALRRDVEQVAETARHTLEVPDVRDRRGQLDVAHALAAHLRARDFDATPLADDALEAHGADLDAGRLSRSRCPPSTLPYRSPPRPGRIAPRMTGGGFRRVHHRPGGPGPARRGGPGHLGGVHRHGLRSTGTLRRSSPRTEPACLCAEPLVASDRERSARLRPSVASGREAKRPGSVWTEERAGNALPSARDEGSQSQLARSGAASDDNTVF